VTRSPSGFTLTEILIVLVVVGILAAIAIPSYRDSTLRARRIVAKAELSKLALKQENYYGDRKSYASSLGADGLGMVAGNTVTSYSVDVNGKAGATAAKALYSISLATTSNGGIVTTWTLTATPQNAQRRDTTCGNLILASDGTKSASSGRSDCWSR
jgi:type IV pilus assembly protein PilE